MTVRAARGVRAHFQPVESILREDSVVTLVPNPPPPVMLLRGRRYVRVAVGGVYRRVYYVERRRA